MTAAWLWALWSIVIKGCFTVACTLKAGHTSGWDRQSQSIWLQVLSHTSLPSSASSTKVEKMNVCIGFGPATHLSLVMRLRAEDDVVSYSARPGSTASLLTVNALPTTTGRPGNRVTGLPACRWNGLQL
jgi:hypothetical protein